jgi:hypothetical protein
MSDRVTVTEKGDLYISNYVGSQIKGDQVIILLNDKGNILVIREVESNGLRLRTAKGKVNAKCVSCRALTKAMKDRGVNLPARFRARFDRDVNGWVCRRVDDENNRK